MIGKKLGIDILQKFQTRVGNLWDGLAAEDKEAIARAAERFAVLSLESVSGVDVERDLAIIEATLDNYAYIGSQRIYRAFWESVDQVVGVGAKFLQGVISSKLA